MPMPYAQARPDFGTKQHFGILIRLHFSTRVKKYQTRHHSYEYLKFDLRKNSMGFKTFLRNSCFELSKFLFNSFY